MHRGTFHPILMTLPPHLVSAGIHRHSNIIKGVLLFSKTKKIGWFEGTVQIQWELTKTTKIKIILSATGIRIEVLE